jgi:DNA-binding NarL/FixJ family response regulator
VRTGPTTPRAEECIRVVICDDHALFRRGLMMALEEHDDIEVIAEAANGAEALEVVTHLAPDVVLMDVRMPQLDGITAARGILETLPTVQIIMLTVSDDEDDLLEALRVGAAGYLLKEVTIDEVGDAVRGVHMGQRLVTPSLATKLIVEFDGLRRRAAPRANVEPRLTNRELEVLALVAEGATNRQVARQLGIADNTVKNHVRNVLEKLRLHSRLDAARYAVEASLISAPLVPGAPRLGETPR